MIISAATRESAGIFATKAVEDLSAMLAASLPADARDELSVSWRLKSEESILAKMYRRAGYSVVNDFIGVRLVVLHVGLVADAVAAVRQWAEGSGLQLEEFDDRFQKPGVAMYRSVHLDFRFARPEIFGLTDVCGIEFQVTTFLQRFHEVFSHALFYKSYAGADADRATVDLLTSLSRQLATIDEFASRLLPGGALPTRDKS